MDIFFQDPNAVPLPPDEVRILTLRAEPWPDQRRVRVLLEITPFQRRPSGEISILDPAGDEAASASIIETIFPKMEFNLHLRGEVKEGEYQVNAIIFYEEKNEDEAESNPFDRPPQRKVIDSAQAGFRITFPASE